MVAGLDKKSLVRGMNQPDAFYDDDSPMGKKVTALVAGWTTSMGSNDNWAGKCKGFVNMVLPDFRNIIAIVMIIFTIYSIVLF